MKKGGDFGEFFLVSVSHETKHENSSKNRGKFGAKFGAKFGTKIEKFRKLSFCNFSDLNNGPYLWKRPRPTQGLPGPSGLEPRKSPERVWAGQGPKTAERLHRGVSKESEKNLNLAFGLFSDSFETPGRTLSAVLGPCPGVVFPDSSGVSGPKSPETLCRAGPIATLTCGNLF